MQRPARERIVQIRVSEDELATMHEMAINSDESVSQLLRRLAREEAARRAEKARTAT